MALGTADLGGFRFRLPPDAISYDYKIDYTTIETLGGQVIQVLGSTLGDITIKGSFGEDRKNKKASWQLAEEFSHKIKTLMDRQTNIQKNNMVGVTQPLPFTFTYKDLYTGERRNWSMKVLIKGIQDATGGQMHHSNGKFSYGYILTLFIVSDDSQVLSKVASDKFIARISKGLGWKRTYLSSGDGKKKFAYSGNDTIQGAIKYIQDNSTDSTFAGYIESMALNPQGTTSTNTTSTPTLDETFPAGGTPF